MNESDQAPRDYPEMGWGGLPADHVARLLALLLGNHSCGSGLRGAALLLTYQGLAKENKWTKAGAAGVKLREAE